MSATWSGAKYMFDHRTWTIDGSPAPEISAVTPITAAGPMQNLVARKGRVVPGRLYGVILPGEEITFDYGDEYFELFFGQIRLFACCLGGRGGWRVAGALRVGADPGSHNLIAQHHRKAPAAISLLRICVERRSGCRR